jgi:hypothetical protein
MKWEDDVRHISKVMYLVRSVDRGTGRGGKRCGEGGTWWVRPQAR